MAELHDDFESRYGLVRVGGDLKPATLIAAYCSGVFPWFDEGWPICWWSPDPRAIFELNGAKPLTPSPYPQRGEGEQMLPSPPWGEGLGVRGLYISRRLARTIRSGKFQVTVNRAFTEVMRGCADRDEGSWVTTSMIEAYTRLHRLGVAHSIETWRDGELAGGLYGVALGGLFAGESMFHRVSDASKVALAFTVEHLQQRGFTLFDTQFVTPHTARMGAVEIPRQAYLTRLQQALRVQASFVDA